MKLALLALCACVTFGQASERSIAFLPAPQQFPPPGSGTGLFLAQAGRDNICVRRIPGSYTVAFSALTTVTVKHRLHAFDIQVAVCDDRARLIRPAIIQVTDADTVRATFDYATSGIIRVIPPSQAEWLFWSQVALGGTSTLDIASSWGARELNPVLGQGRFGMKQAAVSASMTVGVVVISNLVVRKWPRSRRMVQWATFGAAGVRGYAAGRTILQ